jgi:hypothetical protein
VRATYSHSPKPHAEVVHNNFLCRAQASQSQLVHSWSRATLSLSTACSRGSRPRAMRSMLFLLARCCTVAVSPCACLGRAPAHGCLCYFCVTWCRGSCLFATLQHLMLLYFLAICLVPLDRATPSHALLLFLFSFLISFIFSIQFPSNFLSILYLNPYHQSP